ncbi:unnamed protein product [Knipowitschia caucasica]|uniref:Ig-like domain-containing protein n=1 Tax=Knipowitschia caucasica TaxID=637954 RepID=A0AAV2LGE2_KNICA
MFLVLFIVLILGFHGRASKITGHGSTFADYGGEAHYKCKLEDPKDVLQVTWQRLYKDNSIENLATYSKRFGEQVNDPYKGKIAFTETSLQFSSITVRNVTWEDEGCYLCSFNAYPGGSKRHKTCLKVEGVSNVQTLVHKPHGGSENTAIFSCSVTGKPAPEIKWDYSAPVTVLEQSQTSAVGNEDLTITSYSNLTLQLSPNWEGKIDCVINSKKGERRESVVRYEKKKDDIEKERTASSTNIIIISTTTTALLFFASQLLFFG